MQAPNDVRAPRKAVNLSIDADLLGKARQLQINLSATLEHALAMVVKRHQQELWIAQNRDAIEAYNERVEKHGVFSDGARSF
jgi:antitoxin CcdA